MTLLDYIQIVLNYVWGLLNYEIITGISLKVVFLGFLLISIAVDVVVHILQDA